MLNDAGAPTAISAALCHAGGRPAAPRADLSLVSTCLFSTETWVSSAVPSWARCSASRASLAATSPGNLSTHPASALRTGTVCLGHDLVLTVGDPAPVDSATRSGCHLVQEDPLRAPIAFDEGVQHVHAGVGARQHVDDFGIGRSGARPDRRAR